MSNEAKIPPPWQTSEYLQKLLQEILKDDTIEIRDFKIGAASAAGDGYAGQVLRIDLEYDQKNERKVKSIIAKAIPQTDVAKEMTKGGFNMYECEMKMMSTLPLLQNELAAKGITEQFYPDIYKLDTDYKVIFMEDLKAAGFTMVDRKLFIDLDHVLFGIKALGRFHAASYFLFKRDPSLKDKYLDYLFKKDKGSLFEKFSEGCLTYLLKFLNDWPISEEDKTIFRSFKGKIYDLSADTFVRKDSSFNVLCHSDFTMRNMMFKYANEKITSIKIFDYQDCNYNSIGLDINFFLFTSARNYVILEHLEEVFKTYYDSFVSLTGEISGFTLATVQKEFVERLMFGFEVALNLRSVFRAEKAADLDAFLEGRDSETNIEMFRDPEYISDIAKLLPLFKKYGVFKLQPEL